MKIVLCARLKRKIRMLKLQKVDKKSEEFGSASANRESMSRLPVFCISRHSSIETLSMEQPGASVAMVSRRKRVESAATCIHIKRAWLNLD